MFQVTKVIRRMTVMENMLTPAFATHPHIKTKEAVDRANEVLKSTGLEHMKNEYASVLSGGQQRLLEFSRLLMINAETYLLDEPFVAVHPALKARIIENIRRINQENKTFVIVSHDLPSTFGLCNRIVVLDSGTKIAEGSCDEIRRNDKVIEAYLGV